MNARHDHIDPEELARQGESADLEHKLSLSTPETTARVLAGLANSGGGRLVVGVDERRGIVGSMTQSM